MGGQLQYSREKCTDVNLQGAAQSGEDYWGIAVMKTFFGSRLTLITTYIPPLEWFIRKNSITAVSSDFYPIYSKDATFEATKNTLKICLVYRLQHGKKTKEYKNEATKDSGK